MNEAYERNNIYFMYLNCEKQYRYLVIKKGKEFYELYSKTLIGTQEELYHHQEVVIAPIDLVLYHNSKLEFLNRNYSLNEQYKLQTQEMEPNVYRKLKYIYTLEELDKIFKILNSITIEELVWIIKHYENYFKTREEDPVLRIYTI